MYGRELASHSCPPMILPSSRGTATVIHTHAHRGQVRFAFHCSLNCNILSVFMSLYQQLQPSAAEPGVSWCQVNDQRTPSNTAAHIYTPPAPLHAVHPPSPSACFCWPSLCSYQLVTHGSQNRLSYHTPVSMFVHLCPLQHTHPVFMSPVQLTDL